MDQIIAEKLECPICTMIMQEATETVCGHCFCEFCLNQCLETKPNICPVCSRDPSPVHPSFTIRALCDSIRPIIPDSSSTTSSSSSSDAPSSLESAKALGIQCYNDKKYAEAIQHFSLALNFSLKTTTARATVMMLHNNRAQCYIKLGQYRRALDDCDEITRFAPSVASGNYAGSGADAQGFVKAYIRRGRCLFHIGDIEGARSAYQQATRFDYSKQFEVAINDAYAALPRIQQQPPYRSPPVHAAPPQPAPQRPPQQQQQPQQQPRQQQQQQQQQQARRSNPAQNRRREREVERAEQRQRQRQQRESAPDCSIQ